MYKIIFYTPVDKTSPIEKDLKTLNPKQEAKVLRALAYLREFGLSRAISNLRKLTGTSLWELRILGKDNVRIVCASRSPNEIIILHIFTKKKRKTPAKELEVAMNRYKAVVDK